METDRWKLVRISACLAVMLILLGAALWARFACEQPHWPLGFVSWAAAPDSTGRRLWAPQEREPDIMKELEDRQKGIVQKHKVEVGDRVKITDGVFVNFVGTVTEVNHEKGRLSVMVSIFGRDTRVDDLEFWQVEQATAENAG